MAKKTILTEVADAVKSAASSALGAAASAGAGVVVGQTADALSKGGEKLGAETPAIQKAAANTVRRPLQPRKQKRAAATRKAKTTKRKVAAKKASRKSTRRKK
jgi:hypothetical protein